MTLKEIAAEAGVSVSTVSRVINQNGKCPAGKEVRQRILEIAKRTGYIPNAHARSLKMHSIRENQTPCHSIACLFTQTAGIGSEQSRSLLIRGMEEESRLHGYSLKYSLSSIAGLSALTSTAGRPPLASTASLPPLASTASCPPLFSDMAADSNMDGIAIIGSSHTDGGPEGQYLCRLPDWPALHFIYTGFQYLESPIDQIVCDGQKAASDAVDSLVKSGHKRIAYIGGSEYSSPFLGYCAALKKHGLPCHESRIRHVPISMEGGYLGAGELLKSGLDATACFCSNDVIAIGVMRAVRESGLFIPGDISVISMDDINVGRYLDPMLTTVHFPLAEMGRMTAKILIDRIEGGHHLPMKIVLPCHVVERESCGTAPA